MCEREVMERERDGSKSLRSRSQSRKNGKENLCKLILIGIQTEIIGFQASVKNSFEKSGILQLLSVTDIQL